MNKMRSIDIIYIRYFDAKGEVLTLGGIQTYITQLTKLAIKIGFQVRIFQYSDISFEKVILGTAKVIGLPIPQNKRNANSLYERVCTFRKPEEMYITLFATDDIIPSHKVPNSIAIQHGISWDKESSKKRSFLRSFLSKTIYGYRTVKRLNNVEDVVCVDNNFICWHRTQLHERNVNLIPIMNFTKIGDAEFSKHPDSIIRIVFARRFFEYRGTRIFTQAIKKLMETHKEIYVTFAGEGPDEGWLKQQFRDCKNVDFTHYNSEESISFHSQFDIAVVPTTGSEGTSLSLLEAMSAHCAVLCTNVGGMTNIIIDGYNGVMVSPTSDAIYIGLKQLVEDKQLREDLSEKGYETARKGFNLEKWENKWTSVLEDKWTSV